MEQNHEQLNNIECTLGEVLGEMKGINGHLARINGRLDIHSDRIRNVEGEQKVLKTKAAMLGGGLGVGVVVIWEWLKMQFK